MAGMRNRAGRKAPAVETVFEETDLPQAKDLAKREARASASGTGGREDAARHDQSDPKTALQARCGECGYSWPVAFLPQRAAEIVTIFRGVRCAQCASYDIEVSIP